DGIGVLVGFVVTIGTHQNRAAGPDRVGVLALHLVKLLGCIVPGVLANPLPRIVVDLFYGTLDIFGVGLVVVAGDAAKKVAATCEETHNEKSDGDMQHADEAGVKPGRRKITQGHSWIRFKCRRFRTAPTPTP